MIKKKVLITGCAGFIGSNLLNNLLKRNFDVIGIDNLSTGKKKFISRNLSNKKFKFYNFDLLNKKKLISVSKKVDVVFHLAANADVRNGFKNPTVDVKQNIQVTHNILECMRINKIKKIIFTSTASVYGDSKEFPTKENISIFRQTSLYAASKLSCESLITAYSEGYGIDCWIFRLVSNLGENYTHGHIYDFTRAYLQGKKKLGILGNGYQNKSYLYVGDCVNALTMALFKKRSKVNILNLGNPRSLTVKQSLKIILKRLKWSPQLSFEKKKQGWIGDNPKIILDVNEIKKIGWKPYTTVEEAVKLTVNFLVNNKWVFKK
jgi:UDP-glucose 4-epimerase